MTDGIMQIYKYTITRIKRKKEWQQNKKNERIGEEIKFPGRRSSGLMFVSPRGTDVQKVLSRFLSLYSLIEIVQVKIEDEVNIEDWKLASSFSFSSFGFW